MQFGPRCLFRRTASDVIAEGSECVNTPRNARPWDTRNRVACTNAVPSGTQLFERFFIYSGQLRFWTRDEQVSIKSPNTAAWVAQRPFWAGTNPCTALHPRGSLQMYERFRLHLPRGRVMIAFAWRRALACRKWLWTRRSSSLEVFSQQVLYRNWIFVLKMRCIKMCWEWSLGHNKCQNVDEGGAYPIRGSLQHELAQDVRNDGQSLIAAILATLNALTLSVAHYQFSTPMLKRISM